MKNFKNINNPLGDFESSDDGEFPIANIPVPSINPRPFVFHGAIIGEGSIPYNPGSGSFVQWEGHESNGQVSDMFTIGGQVGSYYTLINLKKGYWYSLEGFVTIEYDFPAAPSIDTTMNYTWALEDGTPIGLQGSTEVLITLASGNISNFGAGKKGARAFVKANTNITVGLWHLNSTAGGSIKFRGFSIKSLGEI